MRGALARIRNLAVIIVVCDPVDVFERTFFMHHMCGPFTGLSRSSPEPRGEEECWQNLSVAVKRSSVIDRYRKASRLFMWLRKDEPTATPSALDGHDDVHTLISLRSVFLGTMRV